MTLDLDRDSIYNRVIETLREQKISIINNAAVIVICDAILEEMRQQYVSATIGQS